MLILTSGTKPSGKNYKIYELKCKQFLAFLAIFLVTIKIEAEYE